MSGSNPFAIVWMDVRKEVLTLRGAQGRVASEDLIHLGRPGRFIANRVPGPRSQPRQPLRVSEIAERLFPRTLGLLLIGDVTRDRGRADDRTAAVSYRRHRDRYVDHGRPYTDVASQGA